MRLGTSSFVQTPVPLPENSGNSGLIASCTKGDVESLMEKSPLPTYGFICFHDAKEPESGVPLRAATDNNENRYFFGIAPDLLHNYLKSFSFD